MIVYVIFFSFLCKTVIFIVPVKVIFFCIVTVIVIVILSCTWKIKILNYKIKKANAFLKRCVLTVPLKRLKLLIALTFEVSLFQSPGLLSEMTYLQEFSSF